MKIKKLYAYILLLLSFQKRRFLFLLINCVWIIFKNKYIYLNKFVDFYFFRIVLLV